MLEQFKSWMVANQQKRQVAHAAKKEEQRINSITGSLVYIENEIIKAVKEMGFGLDITANKRLEQCIADKNYSHFNAANISRIEGVTTKTVNGERRKIYLNNATPLHVAAATGSLFCIQTLVKMGFDPLVQDAMKKIPLDYLIIKQGVDLATSEYFASLLEKRAYKKSTSFKN